MASQTLRIGWATTDITPPGPVYLRGQFHARISTHVKDPLTATALVLASSDDSAQFIIVSVDRCGIDDGVLEACRDRLRQALPEIDVDAIVMHATHTHTAPEADEREHVEPPTPVMDGPAYRPLLIDGLVTAIRDAWDRRAPGGIAWGLGHAVVGLNRRPMYLTGEARMYGAVDDPTFAGFEGAEDPSIDLLYTFDAQGALSGVVVNVACPSQVTEGEYYVSADYWHETREELRRRLGDSLFVLPQCSPAGDLSPHPLLRKAAEARMRELKGVSERQEIALRLADAVERVLPVALQDIHQSVELRHEVIRLGLSRRKVTPEERAEARAGQAEDLAEYERLRQAGSSDYRALSRAFHHAQWYGRVEQRCELEEREPDYPVELHLARIGKIAFATNPFELFLDFGLRIEARSPAIQTFCVQLAGHGTYLPTERAVASKSYGAGAPSNVVGPEGGQELVEATVAGLKRLFE